MLDSIWIKQAGLGLNQRGRFGDESFSSCKTAQGFDRAERLQFSEEAEKLPGIGLR